ncbi:MAG: hypothetical protein HeimC3_44720 [Candidatus Heimdallarchaeota archaeon LC_3]|nr:MAG: hypothetical protein HeimC3_44720 [Candidatus Heimdallarchaeota archaeon LC_3]
MNLPDNPDNYFGLTMQEIVRVPSDRVGVLIGKKGNTKLKIEELTSTHLEVNSDENSVIIRPKKKIEDPSLIWVAKDMIKAIARGFNEKIAFTLIDPNIFLRIITLDAKNKKKVLKIRGRIIGENGKARRILEEITRCNISVYGNTVSIVGRYDDGEIDIAQEAIEMLITGVKHGTVYRFLEKFRIQKKAEGVKMWKLRDDIGFDRMWEEFSKDLEKEKQGEDTEKEN